MKRVELYPGKLDLEVDHVLDLQVGGVTRRGAGGAQQFSDVSRVLLVGAQLAVVSRYGREILPRGQPQRRLLHLCNVVLSVSKTNANKSQDTAVNLR